MTGESPGGGREVCLRVADRRKEASSPAVTAGMPAWQVDGLLEDYAHYARGEAGTVSPHVREVTGVEPCDVRQFAGH